MAAGPQAGQGGHAYAIHSRIAKGGKSPPSRPPPYLPKPALSRRRYRGAAEGIWAGRLAAEKARSEA